MPDENPVVDPNAAPVEEGAEETEKTEEKEEKEEETTEETEAPAAPAEEGAAEEPTIPPVAE